MRAVADPMPSLETLAALMRPVFGHVSRTRLTTGVSMLDGGVRQHVEMASFYLDDENSLHVSVVSETGAVVFEWTCAGRRRKLRHASSLHDAVDQFHKPFGLGLAVSDAVNTMRAERLQSASL